ncbi:TolC family protein (plasmid) [Methylocystis rosea]|uniref:TolC family protein n=2 Tax=Methylocystis rosea TaxID=173366 RepID=A0A3G8MDD3_9HYPH|nr:TolC family protein [Methylocystis rosea]
MLSKRPRDLILRACLSMATALGLSGCALTPPGTTEEQAKLSEVSERFEPPIEARELPALPAVANWRDVLHRAFLANGELESAYFEWKAALARVDRDATWPNTNLMFGYRYLFSRDQMKTWDRMTLSGSFMPSTTLQLPIKTWTAGKVALEAARAASERFRTVKFELQRKVLTAYLDLALAREKVRIERDNVNLLKLLTSSAAARSQAGAPLQDMLKAQTNWELAKNNLLNLEAEVRSARSKLNGLLARDAEEPLNLPPTLPAARPVIGNDARLIEVAVDQNPELAALARQVAGRKDAIELARLEFLPDLVPAGSITGNIERAAEMFVMVPTRIPAILAMIRDTEAMARSTEAVLRQTERDRAASFVANLYFMRNAERQTSFYRRRVVPVVEQLINSSREAYAAGSVQFADLIDSQRTYISVRVLVAEARIEREKRLAELEALAGVDIETLGRPEMAPPEPPEQASRQ